MFDTCVSSFSPLSRNSPGFKKKCNKMHTHKMTKWPGLGLSACLASLVLVFHLLPDKTVTFMTKDHSYEYDSMAQVMAMSMTGARTKRNATSNISFYGENARMDDSTTERTRRAVEIRTRGVFSSVVSIGDSTAPKPTQTHCVNIISSSSHLSAHSTQANGKRAPT